MKSSIARPASGKQDRGPELIAPPRKRAYPKRVPSSLMPHQRAWAADSMRAGRSAHQVACELSCSENVVLELWVRAELRRRAA
jgi:hypothetical protein